MPRSDPRYLRRNALVALGSSGDPDLVPLARRFLAVEDAMLREHAAWTLREIEQT